MAEKSIKKNEMIDKKIAFFLPGRESSPIGGYKVVYEYANRFAEAGYKVSIIYPYLLADDGKLRLNPLFRFKRWLGFYYRRWRGHYKVAEWFNLDNCIQKTLIFKFTTRSTKDFSQYKVVATALRTAYELAEVKSIPETNKYYFIQDFEAWGVSDDVVYESYRLPLKKITIAPWLQERVRKVGQDAVLIPNGFDFEYFKLTNPIENRCPANVALLYHKDDRKRCVDSMAALEIVKRQIPELHVTMFGTPEKPDNLPDWYTYHQCPDKETHNEIYNNAAVFVAASDFEGFGLTVGEAMICGCVIACTNNGGFSCMVEHEKTGLLSPVYGVESLAQNIILLITDNDLRIQLAKAGNEHIKQFTWEKAFDKFRVVVED